MSPSWYGDIDLWFKKYAFDEEVMIALFRYCFNKSALHRSYVATVAEAWYKNKIKTFADLDSYFEKEAKVKTLENSIRKKLRLNRALNIYEEAYVEKWNITYGYGMDIIDIALKKMAGKSTYSFEYMDKMISDWHERGLKTPDEINKLLENQKAKPVQKKETKETKANFSQRQYTDLNNFYSNM